MRKQTRVFIDGGGNTLASVQKYRERFPADRTYVFEPNPRFHAEYAATDLILVKQAIWIADGYLPFFVSRDPRAVASSLLEEKLCKVDGRIEPYWEATPLEVECVDFSAWLARHVRPTEHVTLKLDIEGAEYAVLEHLLTERTIDLVDELYVEFHLETLPGKRAEQAALLAELERRGIVPLHWD